MSNSVNTRARARFQALSLEAPVSEAEFLRREIGLDTHVVSESDLAHRVRESEPAIVVVSEPDAYGEVFQEAPTASIVAFLISDEGYSSERLALVRDSPSIRAVFRQYGTERASLGDVARSAWQFIRSTRSSRVSARTLPGLAETGWQTRRRMGDWERLPCPVYSVPLGYTSEFAKSVIEYLHLHVSPTQSLLEPMLVANHERDTEIVFRGALGTAHRQALVESTERQRGSHISLVSRDWAVSTTKNESLAYVESLSRTRCALCPPGSINTETFRFYEAIVCGARPVEPRTALTHLGRPVCRNGNPREEVLRALQRVREQLGISLEDSQRGRG